MRGSLSGALDCRGMRQFEGGALSSPRRYFSWGSHFRFRSLPPIPPLSDLSGSIPACCFGGFSEPVGGFGGLAHLLSSHCFLETSVLVRLLPISRVTL